MSSTTGSIEVDGGVKLHTVTWKASGSTPKAKVLIVHGFADRTVAYEDVCKHLSQDGYEVTVFDQRGFGESAPTKKEYGVSNEHYVFDDLNKVIGSVTTDYTGQFYLFGHSMGGAIVLNYMVKGDYREKITGYVVSGALIEPHANVAPNRILKALLPLIAKIASKTKQATGLDLGAISHNPEIAKAIKQDASRRDLATVELINDMVNRGKRLTSSVFVGKFVNKPLLVCHGKDDKICDVTPVRKFFSLLKIKDKTMLEYEGAYHELHNESKEYQDKFFSDLSKWMNEHVEKVALGETAESEPEPETAESAAPAAAPKAEESVKAEEAPKVEEPVKTEEPAKKVEESVKAEESAKVEEPVKVVDEPVKTVEEPVKKVVEEAPKVEEPVKKVEEAPKVEEPVVEAPKAEEPAVEAPKVEEPEPVKEAPKVEEPEPVKEAPKEPEPVAEAPKVEEPEPVKEEVTEAPKVEEPVTEAAKEPEPAAEAPKVEEPEAKEEEAPKEPEVNADAAQDTAGEAAESEGANGNGNGDKGVIPKPSTDSVKTGGGNTQKKKKNNKKKGKGKKK